MSLWQVTETICFQKNKTEEIVTEAGKHKTKVKTPSTASCITLIR